MKIESLIGVGLGLVLAPLLLGIINRTKAIVAGRKGAPLLQAYYDLIKLMRKGAVYSRTTTWAFRIAPIFGIAILPVTLFLLPCGRIPACISFPGDWILLLYLLGLARFLTIVAALDTGSSFEGMGASREALFSSLAEPALLISIATLVNKTQALSLSGLFSALPSVGLHLIPILALMTFALALVFLAENCRIPFDDPNTHLELTMIHEVMILDYSGPDLAMILYSASLKLWLLGALLVNLWLPLIPVPDPFLLPAFLAGMILVAIATGLVESGMARVRMLQTPQLLVGAGTLAILAFVLSMEITR